MGHRLLSEKVCFYIPSFSGGGAERVFVRLANYFAAKGDEVDLVVNNDDGPVGEIVSKAVQLHKLGIHRTVPAVPKLAAYLTGRRPSIVYSALTPANLTALVARTLSRSNAKIVVSERNQYSASERTFSLPKRIVMRRLIATGYPRADAITAVAGGVADDFAASFQIPRKRIQVIYNPSPDRNDIDLARENPIAHPAFGSGHPVILAIGRLVAQKDYPTLLSAFSILRETTPAHLIILGSGPDETQLRALAESLGISDMVSFEGFRMNRFDYIVRSSLYVMSSINEGFPNTLVEALAGGLPVVCTDCAGNGPREILGMDYPEALVPVGDVNAMVAAMKAQLERPKAADTISRIAERFSIAAIAQQYADLVR